MTGLLANAREILAEQAHYRELLYQIAGGDPQLRNSQKVTGSGWEVFSSVLHTTVSSVSFTRTTPHITSARSPELARFGKPFWNWFASSLT